jgi:ATP-dependent Clp protease adaptor protein ClpS
MPAADTLALPRPETGAEPALGGAWRVVLLNDSVNRIDYVAVVFQRVMGFDLATAERHANEANNHGRSVVWTGARERAEHHAYSLQLWHLNVILETDEAD